MTAAAVGGATLLMTGCSLHLDAGSAGAGTAEAALSKIDGVHSVVGSGTNNLPFAGTASAFVVTDGDLSDEELQAVTDAVGRWVTKHSGPAVSYWAHLEAGGFGFSVGRRAGENKEILGVVDELRHDDRWLGGSVTSPGPSGDGNAGVELAVKSRDDLVSGWRAVQKVGAGSGWENVSLSANAWNTPPKTYEVHDTADFSISNRESGGKDATADPAAEITAYQQVAEKYRVTSASIRPGRVHLHVQNLDDVADATAVVQRAASNSTVIIDGGIITKDEPRDPGDDTSSSDYTEADRLAAVANRDGISAISLKPNRVTVTATRVDTALVAAKALADASPTAPVQSLDVGSSATATEDRGEDGLLVKGSGARLGDSVTAARQLTGFLPARTSFFESNTSVTATVARVEDAAALVRALQPVIPEGTRLQVSLPDQSYETTANLTVVDGVLTIDAARSPEAENELRTRLSETARDAWTG